ncbi:MAG: hypothetical protein ACXVNM_11865 [Bacteroidia bacterium]
MSEKPLKFSQHMKSTDCTSDKITQKHGRGSRIKITRLDFNVGFKTAAQMTIYIEKTPYPLAKHFIERLLLHDNGFIQTNIDVSFTNSEIEIVIESNKQYEFFLQYELHD